MKLREIAKTFYKIEIDNGRHISFWYDCWSEKGVIFDLVGERGFIDLGIRKEATLEEAVLNLRRRRHHRSEVLREVETALESVRSWMSVSGGESRGIERISQQMKLGCC